MAEIADVLQQIGKFTIDALPWLLLGLALAGIIHVFAPAKLFRPISGRFKPVAFAALIGLPLPLCCFGALPVGMEFSRKAGNLGPMFAFLIATPATSVSALLMTYAFFGLNFTLTLAAAVLVAAMFTGLLGTTIPIKGKAAPPCPHCLEMKHENKLVSALRHGFINMGKEILPYIVVGLIIAGIISALMPASWVRATLSSGFAPLLVAMVIALAIYICPTGSIPFIAALVAKGMSMGAALVFLILGPATNYPFLLIIWRKFGARAFGVYLAGLVICSLVFGMLLTWL